MRKPSATTLIAATALFVAMGGVSSAAVLTTDTQTDTQLIHKLAPTLSVKYAKSAGTAKNATTVGGKKVVVFSKKEPGNTAAQVVASVDGIVLKATCDGSIDPGLTIENDVANSPAYFAGSTTSGSGSGTQFNNSALGASPVDISNGHFNGGGEVTVLRGDGRVISIQWSLTGFMSGTSGNCFFGGSIVAS